MFWHARSRKSYIVPFPMTQQIEFVLGDHILHLIEFNVGAHPEYAKSYVFLTLFKGRVNRLIRFIVISLFIAWSRSISMHSGWMPSTKYSDQWRTWVVGSNLPSLWWLNFFCSHLPLFEHISHRWHVPVNACRLLPTLIKKGLSTFTKLRGIMING